MPDAQFLPNPPKSSLASRIFSILLLLAALGAGYHYRAYFQNAVTPACSQPLSYHVGDFDNRFNITEDRFKQAISDAAQIWDKAAGKQLFTYQTNGVMPINLVYDSRQQATDQLKKINVSVDNTESSYNQLKATYDQYKAQYEAAKQQYQISQQQYEAQKQAYETQVAYYNSRGGAPPDAYAQLNAQRDQLNQLAQTLNQQGAALQDQVNTINALVETLNRVGSELNMDVSAYNSVGQNLSEFQEGVFTQEGLSKEIVIYQFDNYASLVRVLAHELGHSLGLDHVDDKNAIMYKLNQSKNEKPTAADLAELKRICKF